MVYAIIPFEGCNRIRLKRKIDSLRTISTHEIDSPKIYFINYGGTLESLYYRLNWGNSSNGIGDGIVLPINQYVGYGPNALWRWLEKYVR